MFEYFGVEMTTTAHWWNGKRAEFERAEVFVRFNPAGGRYEVQVTVAGQNRLVECLARERADNLATLLTAGPGWVRLKGPGLHDPAAPALSQQAIPVGSG